MPTISMLSYPGATEIESFIHEELTPFKIAGFRYKISVRKGDYKGYAVIIELFKGGTAQNLKPSIMPILCTTGNTLRI